MSISPDQVYVLAVAAWMISWWISECVPMGITALLPIILFPAGNISDTAMVIGNYANTTLYLFLGGFMLALGIERTGLHERIALAIIRLFGSSSSGLVFGFFLSTCFLSMWVSNTATALMMLPMARSVVVLLEPGMQKNGQMADARNLSILLCLGIAYAANIGGVATLIGTPPNVVMKGYVQELLGTELSFGRWMVFGIPLSLSLLVITYLLMMRLYPLKNKRITGAETLIAHKWNELGKMKGPEAISLGIFLFTALCWVLGPWFNTLLNAKIFDDTLTAILGGSLMFVFPLDRGFRSFILEPGDIRRLPWDILLLFGGGLSLALGLKVSGWMELVATWSQSLELSPVMLLLLLTLIMLMLTELMSNVALASIFIPVVMGIADAKGYSAISFAVAVGVASSFAFMLPISTPPNAIVYGSGYVPMKSMIRTGIWLNLISVILVVLFVWFLGPYAFGS